MCCRYIIQLKRHTVEVQYTKSKRQSILTPMLPSSYLPVLNEGTFSSVCLCIVLMLWRSNRLNLLRPDQKFSWTLRKESLFEFQPSQQEFNVDNTSYSYKHNNEC